MVDEWTSAEHARACHPHQVWGSGEVSGGCVHKSTIVDLKSLQDRRSFPSLQMTDFARLRRVNMLYFNIDAIIEHFSPPSTQEQVAGLCSPQAQWTYDLCTIAASTRPSHKLESQESTTLRRYSPPFNLLRLIRLMPSGEDYGVAPSFSVLQLMLLHIILRRGIVDQASSSSTASHRRHLLSPALNSNMAAHEVNSLKALSIDVTSSFLADTNEEWILAKAFTVQSILAKNETGLYIPSIAGTDGPSSTSIYGYATDIDDRVIATTSELSGEFTWNPGYNSGNMLGVSSTHSELSIWHQIIGMIDASLSTINISTLGFRMVIREIDGLSVSTTIEFAKNPTGTFSQEASVVKLQVITLAAKLFVLRPVDRTLGFLNQYIPLLAGK
ncbi:uncharacterized protein ARMOST_15239 [Armillaria ostoyae]|uniref:Uncharacterized protein n=1 Tax=Armillaria ostoyae TaxID=47428 RepID=A0A284RSV6_ARMOS|nr:uncharacterized protein ARMOST_15239 [Armillaria ostoyae]